MSTFNFNVEFAIQMKCDSCKDQIEKELKLLESVNIVDINVKEQRLVVELNENSPSAFQIQEIFENKLGLNTIIRGTGEFVTAVSELRGSQKYPKVIGVARFVQNESKQCLLDAVIDGVDANKTYHIGIHQYGDLSDKDYKTIGNQIYSFVNKIESNNAKLSIKSKLENCDLVSFIGRALAIKTDNDIVAAAIVARASRIMDNLKKVCACSGKTLWEEREDNR